MLREYKLGAPTPSFFGNLSVGVDEERYITALVDFVEGCVSPIEEFEEGDSENLEIIKDDIIGNKNSTSIAADIRMIAAYKLHLTWNLLEKIRTEAKEKGENNLYDNVVKEVKTDLIRMLPHIAGSKKIMI